MRLAEQIEAMTEEFDRISAESDAEQARVDGILARLVAQFDDTERAYADALQKLSEGFGDVAACARLNACASELEKAVLIAEKRVEETRERLAYATHDPSTRRGALQTQLVSLQDARSWVRPGDNDEGCRSRVRDYLEKALAASPEDFQDAIDHMVGRSMVREVQRWRMRRMAELPAHAIETLDAVGAKAA